MGFIRLLISPPRPSALTDMPASVNRFLCRKGYTAITLFGRLFTREEASAAHLNKKYPFLVSATCGFSFFCSRESESIRLYAKSFHISSRLIGTGKE